MIKKTKILFFVPSLVGGGAEKVLINLVNNMDTIRFDITVQCLFAGGVNEQYLSSKITYKTIFKKSFRGNIHLFKLFSPEQLFRYMINDEYDIVVSYLQGPTTRIVAGCTNPNTKIINWVHNEITSQRAILGTYRTKKELLKCLQEYNATVFVSQVAKKSFEKYVFKSSDFIVLYNTNEVEKILQQSQQMINEIKYDNFEEYNLISSGRFVKQKNFERLIAVVARLVHQDQLPVHLYLLGKGELQSKYRELSRKLDIQDNITYLGYQKNPYKFVRTADVFICSSLHEGFSTAVSESVIVGTPVITTECSGMKEILGENNEFGIVCENEDEALYQAVKTYLQDESMQKKYKQKVVERRTMFDTKKSVQAVEDFFLSL